MSRNALRAGARKCVCDSSREAGGVAKEAEMEKTGASPLRAVRIFSMRVTKLQAKSARIIGKNLFAEVLVNGRITFSVGPESVIRPKSFYMLPIRRRRRPLGVDSQSIDEMFVVKRLAEDPCESG